MSKIIYDATVSDIFLDTCKINIKNIKKNNVFAIKINLEELTKYKPKKMIKKILKIRKKVLKNKKIQNDFNGAAVDILNHDENNVIHTNFIYAIEAILKDDEFEMYNYIYDKVCEYLDNFFYGKNLCDFKNNKCGEKRNTSSDVGCCRYYKNRILGPFLPGNKLIKCRYLKDNKCSAKCISCKLFTCDYLEKKGVKFKINDIFLLDTFFNPIQKVIIKLSVYTPKEIIIKRLLQFKV